MTEKKESPKPKAKAKKLSAEQIKAERAYFLGRKFVEEYDVISIDSGYYNYKEGVWIEIPPKRMFSWVNSSYIEHYEPTTRGQVMEVIRNMEAVTFENYRYELEALDENELSHTINLKDNVLEIGSFQTREYTREEFAFYKLPFNLTENVNIQDAKHFLRFITSSMDFKNYDPADSSSIEKLTEEEVQTMAFIQEWMGYSLMAGNKLHKNLIMIGEGRNGKGVFTDVWSAMLGSNNVSMNDLAAINNTQTISMTKNKLINFSYDLEAGQQLDTGVVKSATSGETVMANEKYKDPYFFTFTAKLVIACNTLPYIKNTGFAIKERFYVLPFTRSFTENERDPDLKRKIIDNEMEIIFNWAVAGLKRLLKRGRFDAPKRCLVSMDDYIMDNDTVNFWISEENMDTREVATAPDVFIKGNELYKFYKDFCVNGGLKPLGLGNFYKSLRVKGYDSAPRNGYRGFKGLRKPTNASDDAIIN